MFGNDFGRTFEERISPVVARLFWWSFYNPKEVLHSRDDAQTKLKFNDEQMEVFLHNAEPAYIYLRGFVAYYKDVWKNKEPRTILVDGKEEMFTHEEVIAVFQRAVDHLKRLIDNKFE